MFSTPASKPRPDRRIECRPADINFDATGLVPTASQHYSLAMHYSLHRLIIAIAVTTAASSVAFAGDSTTPLPKGALPGVTSDYRIAKPAPEPDDALPAGENGTFKIGDTDVRISGSVTIDVGVGATGQPRH